MRCRLTRPFISRARSFPHSVPCAIQSSRSVSSIPPASMTLANAVFRSHGSERVWSSPPCRRMGDDAGQAVVEAELLLRHDGRDPNLRREPLDPEEVREQGLADLCRDPFGGGLPEGGVGSLCSAPPQPSIVLRMGSACNNASNTPTAVSCDNRSLIVKRRRRFTPRTSGLLTSRYKQNFSSRWGHAAKPFHASALAPASAASEVEANTSAKVSYGRGAFQGGKIASLTVKLINRASQSMP